MVFLELLAMLGGAAYGTHSIKKGVSELKTDHRISPGTDESYNKLKIENHFVDICKRMKITLNDDKPVYLEDVTKGMEYLQYRGFSAESVDFF